MQRSSTRLSLERLSPDKRHTVKKGIVWHDSYYLSLFGLLFLAGLTMGTVLVQVGTSQYLIDNFSKLTGIVLNRQTNGQGFFYAFYYQCLPLLIYHGCFILLWFFCPVSACDSFYSNFSWVGNRRMYGILICPIRRKGNFIQCVCCFSWSCCRYGRNAICMPGGVEIFHSLFSPFSF